MVINATATYTSGGSVIIFGANFGNDNKLVVVYLGEDECSNVIIQDGTMITCSATGGVGKNWHVTVIVNGESNVDANTAFSRIPPRITAVQVRDDYTLIVAGSNFGDQLQFVQAEISNYTCVVTQIDHYRLVCQYPESADVDWEVWHTLSVNIFGQETSYLVTPNEYIAASSKLSTFGLLTILCVFVSLFFL